MCSQVCVVLSHMRQTWIQDRGLLRFALKFTFVSFQHLLHWKILLCSSWWIFSCRRKETVFVEWRSIKRWSFETIKRLLNSPIFELLFCFYTNTMLQQNHLDMSGLLSWSSFQEFKPRLILLQIRLDFLQPWKSSTSRDLIELLCLLSWSHWVAMLVKS